MRRNSRQGAGEASDFLRDRAAWQVGRRMGGVTFVFGLTSGADM